MLSSASLSSFKRLHFAFFLRFAIPALPFTWMDKTHANEGHYSTIMLCFTMLFLSQSKHKLYCGCFGHLLRPQLQGILSLLSPLSSVLVSPPLIVPPGLLVELQINTQIKDLQGLSYFPKVYFCTKVVTCLY